jgi:hypothetical protein
MCYLLPALPCLLVGGSFEVVVVALIKSNMCSYTLQSISCRTDFLITELEISISHPTNQVLSTNIHSHTEFRLFIFDSVRVINCLVKSVFFIRHGWRKWTESCHKMLFQSRSICDRNTSIGAKCLWEWDSEPFERFRWYSRFPDGRELVEDDERGGRPKSTQTEVNIAAVADLVKNDSRIPSRMIAESLNIPKTIVLRILKEDLGKRKLCARYVPHSLTPERREDRVTSCQDITVMADADTNFLTKLLREMRPDVLPMTPKQSDRVLNRLVRHPLGRRNWNSKIPASRPCW